MYEQAVVGEQMAGRSASVRKKLIELNSDIKASTFDLADLLFEAQENSYPAEWGFSSVLEYGTKELGLKERKVQYLTRLTKVCRAVGLKREQYEPAGISKLRVICTLGPESTFWNKETRISEPMEDHIIRLILDSDTMTVVNVKDEVARLKGQVGPDRRVVRSYSTSASAWENVISKAIEAARRFLGTKQRDDEGNAVEYSEGDCYECICATFNADPNWQDEPIEPNKEAPVLAPKLPMEEI